MNSVNIEEMIKEFRRPFSPEDVNYKIQTVGQKACLCVAYVDARHVQERLNAIAPSMWSNSNREIFEEGKLKAVEASIIIRWFGVEKQILTIAHSDVGSFDNVNEDSHGLKAVYSDAFKRAAVHFGIGVSLYSLDKAFLYKNSDHVREKNGKPVGITDSGQTKLKSQYEKEVIKLQKKFGEIYV